VEAAATFVSGQSSAVVAAINGARPVPTTAPPSVHARGVGGRPTLVQNVETLAQLALLARYGPDWFRGLGTRDEPGTRLVTVSGVVRSPGVYEVAGGSPLASVLDLAGGLSMPAQALLVGGYHGGWVPWNTATANLPHSRTALAGYGADPGAGVVVALSAAQCGLRAGAEIAAYLAGQSAGQCGPCVNGLPAVAEHLARLAAGRAEPSAVRELHRVVGLVEGRGACHHPDGTARLVRSTLATFAAEVELHQAGRCSAASFQGGR
jgi:NADH:ubiquinone oxidoreductase subunit F (NADH-binding)